ncbi:CotH kinase family protein [Paenibacillus cellulositrophicus]|uniref:CotH kinase family protein n=1 Tax=Paenibacillus cellulositrophicus TaxID=562959 RepID=UPI00126747C6|nr:CotH kinase family protein [Paenibacillus cellulositrophicus]
MGLPVYRIELKDSAMKKLESNIWSDSFVSGTMSMDGRRTPIRIRYRGGHTREYPKKSYEIRTAKATYHFNAEHDDPSLMRNALSFHYFNVLGVPSPSTKHCVLYMNGKKEGVYLRIEAVKSAFFRKRGLHARSIIYAVNDNADFAMPEKNAKSSRLLSGYAFIKGGETDRNRLSDFIRSIHRKKGTELSDYLRQRLDMDNYLRWLCGAVLTGNYDGFLQNYTIFESGKRSKYGMIPWDYEGTWGRNCYGKAVKSDLVRIKGYNVLTGKVLAYKANRQKYKRILERALESNFTLSRLMPVVRKMHSAIAQDIYDDPKYKWDVGIFDTEPDVIREYIEDRRRDIKNEMEQL